MLGILAGLDTPSSGQVRLMGKNIFEMNEDARAVLRAQSIGFVFQSFQLLPNLTALENVMLPLELQGQPAWTPPSRCWSGSDWPHECIIIPKHCPGRKATCGLGSCFRSEPGNPVR